MRIPLFLTAFSACVAGAFAASCLENRDFYQSLPTVIGREDQVGKYPFALNCDTVFVRKGVTTVIALTTGNRITGRVYPGSGPGRACGSLFRVREGNLQH